MLSSLCLTLLTSPALSTLLSGISILVFFYILAERERKRKRAIMAAAPVDFKFNKGSLLGETADLIAISVDGNLSSSLYIEFKKKVGMAAVEAAHTAARNGSAAKRIHNGEAIVLNLCSLVGGNGSKKYCALIVHPDQFHLKMAYRNIFARAKELHCATVAFTGLGCGQLGIPPNTSAGKCAEIIKELAENDGFGSIKTVTIVDQKSEVVRAFESKITRLFDNSETSSPKCPENGEAALGAAAAFCHRADTIANDTCCVCMDGLGNGEEVVELNNCKHQYHMDCLNQALTAMNRQSCLICNVYFAAPVGDMPEGSRMTHSIQRGGVPGFDCTNTIVIHYSIPGGVQGPTHRRPGVPFHGTSRTAYLPDNEQGRKVLRLLEKAFECRLTFTVGDSVTSGAQNVVTWNNIHHKTSIDGGSSGFGYPDPTYLDRVTEELSVMGITEAMLNE